MKNITIIGGGACGVAVCVELVLQMITLELVDQVQINLIEKDEKLGYGLAFGTDQPGHLLNTQAELMGIHAAEPGHFADWLESHGGKGRKDVKGKGPTEHTYTTRKLYGDYVAEQAKRYLEKAQRKGFHLDIIQAEAIDIHRDRGKYRIVCHNSRDLLTDYVVLAVGTPKPNNYKELREYHQYIDFPWPSEWIIQRIKPGDHVGILGTSLSAIDAIMTLIDNGHTGKISLFSSDGILPRVQPVENKAYARKFLTLENIHRIKRETFQQVKVKQLFRLFQQEVEDFTGKTIDWKGEGRMGKAPDVLLNRDISCAEKGGDEILTIVYSLRYEAGMMWKALSLAEKERFKQWLDPYWMINRHAMSLYNAYRLQSLFKEKRLSAVPGLSEVAYQKEIGKFILKMENAPSQAVDKMINATGSPYRLEQMECVLLDNLLKKGLLVDYPIGGALINERTMQVTSPHGGDGIYALGHLVNGILPDVNAVWFNVQTAATLAKDILFKIKF